jgi:hypothetical protein
MSISKSYENLKAIRFAGELLPNWAQLLDIAARLCPVPEEARHWFSRFTTGSGVNDVRTVIDRCSLLREAIQAQRDSITAELRRIHDDIQPAQIFGAWIYALDTMIQAAKTNQTCSWTIEGSEDTTDDGSAGGEIGLRRV